MEKSVIDEEKPLKGREGEVRGIFAFDRNGVITFGDLAFHRILGYENGELIGTYIFDLLEPAPDKKQLSEFQKKLFKEQPESAPYIARCKKKNGQTVDVKVDWGYQRDLKNRITGFASTLTDLAMLEKYKKQLRTLEEVSQVCLEASHQEEMLEGVLHSVLEGFECDRAWLLYPCDPDTPTWKISKEVTRPQWPGLAVEGEDIPMDESMAIRFSESLAAFPEVLTYTQPSASGVVKEMTEKFSVQSQMMIALRPKVGKPWLMGVHYCEHPHAFSEDEKELFVNIGKKMSETLSSLLSIQSLTTLQRRLNEAQRIAGIGSWEWNVKTGKIFWSEAMYDIFGVSPGSFTPTYDSYMALIHEDDRKRVSEHIAQSLDHQDRKIDIEYRICLPGGKESVIKGRGEVLRDEKGTPAVMQGTAQDITEQRKQTDLLQLQNEITANMTEAVSMIRSDGIIVYTNASLDQMFGYEHGELIGKHVEMLNSPAGNPPDETVKEIMRALSKNKIWIGRVENIKKDGTTFITAASISSFQHSEYGFVWVSLQTDITGKVELEKELKRSKDNLSEAQRIAKTGSWEWNIPAAEISWSDQLYHIFGVSAENFKLTYETFMNCIHPADREAVHDAIQASLYNKDIPYHIEYRVVRPDGREVMILGIGEVFWSEEGEPVRMIGTVQDITERKLIEERQLLSAKVVENSAEAIVVTDADNQIISVNRAYTDITGYTPEEVIGKKPRILKSGLYDEENYLQLWKILLKDGKWQGELVDRRKNGEIFPSWQTISVIRNKQGKIINFLSLISDISSIKSSQKQLQFMAYHDPLTRLPNRLLMSDRLNHAIQRAKREDHMVAVIFVDLDRFKTINDSLGHPIGDHLLKETAERIQHEVREADTVARLGGDEFVIILEKIYHVQYAAILARKLMKSFERPFIINGRELHISLSIGISIFPGDGEDSTALLKNADAAMYRAKEQGRNDYQFYTSVLTTYAFERLTLETALRHALENRELVLYYQPQYELSTGKILGVEALVRWKHPDLGIITPDKFIPLAEESGLIVSLGEWILRSAVRQMVHWQKTGYPLGHMAVNVSGRQFRKNEIGSLVKDVLKDTGLDPACLEIEITESILMQEVDHGDVLGELKELGVHISIDDFGTGYSSLSYLKQLPVHKLKIDQSFVRDIAVDPSDAAIIKAVIALGQSMQLDVIAEGVETELQQDLLRSLGCRAGQGYLCSPPVPENDLEQVFQGNC